MTVDLTNNETGTVTVNGKRNCYPAHHCCGRDLWSGCHQPERRARNAGICCQSSVAAFVCLPGVKDSLDGLPDDLSTVEDYLQDSVTVEADVENLTAPQVSALACANADALAPMLDLSSINELTDGIGQLNDAMNQPDGWCRPTGGRWCFPAGQRYPGPCWTALLS